MHHTLVHFQTHALQEHTHNTAEPETLWVTHTAAITRLPTGGMFSQHANQGTSKQHASEPLAQGLSQGVRRAVKGTLPLDSHMATAACSHRSSHSSSFIDPKNTLPSTMQSCCYRYPAAGNGTDGGWQQGCCPCCWLVGRDAAPAAATLGGGDVKPVAGAAGVRGRHGMYRVAPAPGRASTGSAAATVCTGCCCSVMVQPDLTLLQPADNAALAWQLRGGSGGVA
jgi:hypothetical protein